MSEMTGGCMCGKVRYTAEIEDDDAYLCHCRMCQRSSGNVSLAMKGINRELVRWEGEPDYFQSSPFAKRGFCATCGTSLTFEYTDGSSPNIDLIVGTFDDPSRFKPKHHFGAESMHRAWLDTEGLPEMRSEDYKPLAERWMKSVGKLPD
jgi:hypothetical protein